MPYDFCKNGTFHLFVVLEKTNMKSEFVSFYLFVCFFFKVTNVLFVVGGMFGALTSKYVLDFFGRKNGVLFHYLFTLAGSVLVFIAPMFNLPELLMTSRFLYGIQGGMACGLVPTYLSEISPTNLRGATGVIHQLNLTIGILVAQLLGFRQLLGA